MKQIILASGSPRRKELLEETGIKFIIIDSEFEENFDPGLNPQKIVEKLSLGKAQTVYKNHKNSIIIAADTIVQCDEKILGKPKDQEDAKLMLEFLSGKVHALITGFTIIDGQNIITKSQITKITMRKISNEEIYQYLKTKEPYDKAGAYAIQGIAKKFIEKIEGDLSNAIGLPIKSLLTELKKLGVNPAPTTLRSGHWVRGKSVIIYILRP